jgi:opacity protein-like surface antigen
MGIKNAGRRFLLVAVLFGAVMTTAAAADETQEGALRFRFVGPKIGNRIAAVAGVAGISGSPGSAAVFIFSMT